MAWASSASRRLWLRAPLRSTVKASATSTCRRSASTPLACSIRTQLFSACGVPARGSAVLAGRMAYRGGIRVVCDGHGGGGRQARYEPSGRARRSQAARRYS
jgi:hypothetical protein